VAHEQLFMELVVPEDGYMYIYLSNESDYVSDVYFDDFKVTHQHLVADDAHNPDLIAYRYGFNGKEKDQSGEFGLTSYDYGFRIYNPAIAKFLSVDPLTASYPWYTPYQFAGNKPIMASDLDGLEEKIEIYGPNDNVPNIISVEQEGGINTIENFFKAYSVQGLDPNSFIWGNGEKEYKGIGAPRLRGTLSIKAITKNITLLSYNSRPLGLKPNVSSPAVDYYELFNKGFSDY